MTTEQWMPVLGYEGIYSVSNLGRVRREISRTRGKAGHIMKLTVTRGDYVIVGLSKNGKSACRRVHRLVCEAFVGPIREGMVVNHLDGNPKNNVLGNLSIVTNSENVLHAFRELGRRRPGEKLDTEKVIAIRKARAIGSKLKDLAAKYDVSLVCISSVCTGKTWKHAGGPITPARAVSATPQAVVARLGPDVVEDVRRRYAAGEGPTALARELDVSRRTILNWCQGKTRRKD